MVKVDLSIRSDRYLSCESLVLEYPEDIWGLKGRPNIRNKYDYKFSYVFTQFVGLFPNTYNFKAYYTCLLHKSILNLKPGKGFLHKIKGVSVSLGCVSAP